MNIPPNALKQQLVSSGIEPVPQPTPLTEERPMFQSPPNARPRVPSIRQASDLADLADVSTDTMPVLQAFQEFLETERKHARRQIMAVTIFFLMLFIIIAGAGTFFGVVYVGKMNSQMTTLHRDLATTKRSLKQETSDMLLGLKARTDALTAKIVDGDTLIKEATSEISSTVSNSLAMRLGELAQIRSALSELREENMDLRLDLARIRTESSPPTPVATVTVSEPALPLEQPATVNVVPPIKTPKVRATEPRLAPLELAILAPGSSETIKWRIPIEE
jgi:hypothetical protein